MKVNFDVRKPILVSNRVELDGQAYDFRTELQFARSAAVVVQMCSHQNGSFD